MDKENQPLFMMENITKVFPGVVALNDVSFSVAKQSVHAIVGQNGAGKSTLINVLTGSISKNKDDKGRIFIENKEIEINNNTDAIKYGIECVHQEMLIVPDMSVGENVCLGNFSDRSVLSYVNYKNINKRTKFLFDLIGTDIDPKRRARDLGIAEQQILMIARALNRESRLIIMDEPTASLDVVEIKKLFEIIRKLIKSNHSIIYISHHLNEIFEIADEVTVLRNGKKIINEKVKKLNEKQIIEYMLGYKTSDKFIPNNNFGQVALEVKDLSYGRMVMDVNFQVREGEVLGIAGHLGSGRTELVKSIMGELRKDKGKIYLFGKEVGLDSAYTSVNNSLGVLTEERFEGIIPQFSVMNNITITNLRKISKFMTLSSNKEKNYAKHFIELLKIKVSSPLNRITSLSGGNQQKVIVAKWLFSDAKVLFLDEPTKGIDIGAKNEILSIIIELAKKGVAIVMISSELGDLTNVCNRVMIMARGKFMKEIYIDDNSSESFLESEINYALKEKT